MYDKIDASTLNLNTKMVSLDRVSKTVKGGRKMKFSALVVVNPSKFPTLSAKLKKMLRRTS